jgi:hypothetical protein
MDLTDIVEARAAAFSGVLDAAAILLTLISGYFTGLFFFISRTTLFVRAVAAMILTLGFGFLALMMVNFKHLLDQLDACEACAMGDTVRTLFGAVANERLAMLTISTNIVLGLGVWLILIYLTIFPKWVRPDADDHPIKRHVAAASSPDGQDGALPE